MTSPKAKTKPKKPTPSPEYFAGMRDRALGNMHITEDGSLSNKVHEQYALLRAEGVDPMDAWRGVGKNTASGEIKSYRGKVERSPVFQKRLEALVEEKAELEKEGTWGRVKAMANHLWLQGCARNDVAIMQKAAELMTTAAQKTEKQPPAPKPEGRGPGAPLVETPPEEPSEADAIRRRQLVERGLGGPTLVPDEVDDDDAA